MREYLSIKKSDLHIHLEGSVEISTFKRLAEKNKIDLLRPVKFKTRNLEIPAPKLDFFSSNFSGNFLEFIKLYIKISETICEAEDIVSIIDAYAQNAEREKVTYAEMYVTPSSLLELNLTEEELTQGLIKAQQLAKNKYQLEIKWIFDIVRGNIKDQNFTLDLATKLREIGVEIIALGLAGPEMGNLSYHFKDAFNKARDRGFNIYAHAGETAGAESIWDTIENIAPQRIGHGIRAIDDENLIKEIIKREIILEVCPWSNIYLEVCTEKNHPLKQLVERGVKVVICSDDPGIFGKTLNDNLKLAEELGLSEKQLSTIIEFSNYRHK
ncbi:MAG: adenosine deaminase [Proteobacteria bacterium]|nr:adenosine deaminase [Pseudomonadota bacterium]